MLSIQARLLTPILEGEKPEFMDFETPPSLQRRQKFLSQRASCFETWPKGRRVATNSEYGLNTEY